MKRLQKLSYIVVGSLMVLGLAGLSEAVGQTSQAITDANSSRNSSARSVTIPVTFRIKEVASEASLQTTDLVVSEDGEPQTITSIRSVGTNSPITLAVLIQEDLPTISNEIKGLAEFLRNLPKGSRVMVGYLRTGSLQVKLKFTTDLEKAAKVLRPPNGFANSGPYNPYVEVIEALRKFDSQPQGRRAILLISDGLDISRGYDSSLPTQSLDLRRAVSEAQRKSVAVYGFYAPTAAAEGNSLLASNAQSSLNYLANETGGHAFFQGIGAPVSFDPFLKELDNSLERQAALTFLSTHPKKGFHKIAITSTTPGIRVVYPTGYVRQ
jgi:VWFA-related protein